MPDKPGMVQKGKTSGNAILKFPHQLTAMKDFNSCYKGLDNFPPVKIDYTRVKLDKARFVNFQ